MPYPRTTIKEKFHPKPPRLIDQVHQVLRYHHYAMRTEAAYVRWILQFIRCNDKKHPTDMGKAEIEQFLSYLAMGRKVVAST